LSSDFDLAHTPSVAPEWRAMIGQELGSGAAVGQPRQDSPRDESSRHNGRRGRAHVLTLVDHLATTGGAERLAVDIATRLDPARFRSTLCATRYPGQRAAQPSDDELHCRERLRQAGASFLSVDRRRRADLLTWRTLASYLRREKVDVIHAHMFGSNAWGTAIGRLARVPVIIAHEHTWAFEGEPIRKLLDRELIGRFSDVFLAVSQEDRRKMIEIERVPAERIRVLANGITPRAPTPGRDVRAELGLGDGPLVGAAGALRPQKAYDNLIRAAVQLAPRHPGLHVLICGEGPDRPRLETLIAELGAGETVKLLGRRLDVPDILAVLDVAVCASDYEGSPLAVMEYMEAALPIVATRVGGVPDLIDDEVHGLLVAPDDPSELVRGVERMLADRASANAMGANARVRRRAEFDLDVMIDSLQSLYEELLLAHRRP
jgi:glycosyltransferase involved in cell wall biosynthesis